MRNYILADPECVARGIKAANTPDLTSTTKTQPIKSAVQDKDHPEILLYPVDGDWGIGFTNIGHRIDRRISIRLSGGQTTLQDKYYPVQWALFCAFVRLHRNNPTLGLEFIEKITVVSHSDGFGDNADAQRGTRGWVSLMTVQMNFRFDDKDLKTHCYT